MAASYPHSGEVLMALVAFNLKLGATEVARDYARRMLKDDPRLGSVEQIMGLDTR